MDAILCFFALFRCIQLNPLSPLLILFWLWLADCWKDSRINRYGQLKTSCSYKPFLMILLQRSQWTDKNLHWSRSWWRIMISPILQPGLSIVLPVRSLQSPDIVGVWRRFGIKGTVDALNGLLLWGLLLVWWGVSVQGSQWLRLTAVSGKEEGFLEVPPVGCATGEDQCRVKKSTQNFTKRSQDQAITSPWTHVPPVVYRGGAWAAKPGEGQCRLTGNFQKSQHCLVRAVWISGVWWTGFGVPLITVE